MRLISRARPHLLKIFDRPYNAHPGRRAFIVVLVPESIGATLGIFEGAVTVLADHHTATICPYRSVARSLQKTVASPSFSGSAWAAS